MAMSEVASMGQVQAKYGIARLQQRHESGHVGLRAGMWLDIGMLCAKKLAGPVACHVLHDVGKFATPIISLARIPFRVLTCEHRAHGLKHSLADKVF